jgi:hypothetical protein
MYNRIKWTGQILRMNEGRIPKKGLKIKLKGKNARGRPR